MARCLCLTVVAVNLSTGALSPLLPTLKSAFQATYWEMALLTSAFGVARLACDLPFGRVILRLGPRLTLVAGVAAISIGSLVAAVAPGLPGLMLARALSGVGSSACFVVALVLLSDADARSTAFRLSLYEVSGLLGFGASTLVSGVAATLGSWRWAFVIGAITPWLPAVMFFRSIPPGRPADSASAAQAMTAGMWPWRLIILTTALVLSLLWHGVRTTLTPLYAGEDVGLPARTIGVILSVGFGAGIVGLLGAGTLVRRVSPLRVLEVGLLLAAGAIFLTPLAVSARELTLVHCLLALSLGVWSLPSALLLSGLPPSTRSAMVARYRLVVDLGLAASPALVTAAAGAFGYSATFRCSGVAVLGIVGVLAALGRGPRASGSGRPRDVQVPSRARPA